MSLRSGAERVLDIDNLEEGEPDFLACVALRVKVANSYLLPSRIAVNTDLDDGFLMALNGCYCGSVGARGRWRMTSEQAAYRAQGTHFPCIGYAGETVTQGFWDIVGCAEVMRIKEGLGLLADSW